MREIGPVEYMIVAFPGNKFTGQIAPALAELVESGTIRIIDLTFVGKDADGNTAALELLELDPEVQEAFEQMGAEVTGLLGEDDIALAAEALDPNSSAALLVWEDLWAGKLTQAIRDADGVLIDIQRVPHEVVQAAREAVAEEAAVTQE
jgi:Family of unknown function (DUF6325)